MFANKVINRVIGKTYKVSTVAYPMDFVETVVMEGGLLGNLGMHNWRWTEYAFDSAEGPSTWTLEDSSIRSKAGWSPYSGVTMLGKIVQTLLRGETIAEHDNIAEERTGEWLLGAGFVEPSR